MVRPVYLFFGVYYMVDTSFSVIELFTLLEYNKIYKIRIGEGGKKSEKTYFRYSSHGNRCYQHNFYPCCDSIISVKSVLL